MNRIPFVQNGLFLGIWPTGDQVDHRPDRRCRDTNTQTSARHGCVESPTEITGADVLMRVSASKTMRSDIGPRRASN
jgi:hypothetical protein